MLSQNVIVIDTETTNSIDDPFVYDIGFAVFAPNGNMLATYSFVVADIFLDDELMSSAYFIDKMPSYWEDIKCGKRTLKRFKNIKKIFREVCRQYDVHIVIAHNARFDYHALNLTSRFLTNSKYRFFFPYGMKIWDSLKMSRKVFGQDNNYIDFCHKNAYLTTFGKLRFTAEILYRYLINNNDFIEAHTALQDVLIEKDIFFECIKRNPTINGALWEESIC